MRISTCCIVALLVAASAANQAAQQPPAATPAPGDGQQELVKKTLDPTASLMSFVFRDIVTPNYYGRTGSGNSIQFQPVVPFKAFGSTNILRFTLPYNTGGVPGKGLGSIQVFNLTVLPFKGGRIGIGPVMNIVSNPALTEDRFQFGPAIGYITNKGNWILGAFNQNLFSADTQISAFQPAIGYALGGGWAVAAGDAQWTVDWEAASSSTYRSAYSFRKSLAGAASPCGLL